MLIKSSSACPPRGGGWRVSRRHGWIFPYQAACMLGLVCHILDSSAAANQLRSSHMLDSRFILVLLVPCTNLLYRGPIRIFWRRHPRRGASGGCAGKPGALIPLSLSEKHIYMASPPGPKGEMESNHISQFKAVKSRHVP